MTGSTLTEHSAGAARRVVEVTGDEAFAAWGRRELPPVEKLAGGVLSVPVPITGHTLRYTLVYVLECSSGPVLIDAGWPDGIAWDALAGGLASVGLTPGDIHGVLVTHAHSDHHGLAGRLREASGCWIGMHRLDIEMLANMANGRTPRLRSGSFLELVGAPHAERSQLRMDADLIQSMARATPDRVVEDGARDLVPGRSLVAHWTPGHTPGHLVFVDEDRGFAFSGDHLLPRLTSHIGLYELTADVLGKYVESLNGMEYLTDATEILPAHEYRFRGAQHRIAQLVEHHEHRSAEVEQALTVMGSATVWDVAAQVSWSRGWEETTGSLRRLALAETLAHLRHLETTGAACRSDDAVPRWSAAQ